MDFKIEKNTEFRSVAIRLIEEGYKTIVAGYEGSGDSGGIEYISASENDPETAKNEASYWDQYGDDIRNREESGIVENIIDNLTGDIEDWWNNDGGYGIVIIDLLKNNYAIFNNVRYTQTNYYEHEGNVVK